MSEQLDRILRTVDGKPVADVVRGVTINPEPIDWRWRGYLAAGKPHVLAGAPGTGKTTLALALAATLTVGGSWPDGTQAATGDVLVCSYEDDPADTLIPRLAAMDANLSRIHVLRGIIDHGGTRAFNAARDLTVLTDAVRHIADLALVIVDPMVSAMGLVDSHKNLETRQALQPLSDFATRTGAAVLGITHLAKGSAGRDPLERLLGSVAFGAMARVVMGAAKIDDNNRVFARIKSNIGPDGGGFHYDLVPTKARDIETVAVLWGSALEGSARELLTTEDDIDPTGSKDALTEAKEFLLSIIESGTTGAKEIYRHASDAGIAKRTLERAKARLGIRATKTRFDGGWEWKLPEPKAAKQNEPETNNQQLSPEGCQDRLPDRLATLATFACPECAGNGCELCFDTGRNPEMM